MLHRQNRQEVFKKCASISPSFELIRDAEVYGPGRGEAAVTEQSLVPSTGKLHSEVQITYPVYTRATIITKSGGPLMYP